jgi:hypothetical protein
VGSSVGGFDVIYRCPNPVCGATRTQESVEENLDDLVEEGMTFKEVSGERKGELLIGCPKCGLYMNREE